MDHTRVNAADDAAGRSASDPATAPETTSALTASSKSAALAAIAYFSAKLDVETDPSDVAAALDADPDQLVVVDSRGDAAWSQGHVRGAIHLPAALIPTRAAEILPVGRDVVVYCWGPGCNAGTKAALALARLGYPVKEMIGGFEYWAREGLPVETGDAVARRVPDPLTAPVVAPSCDC